MSLDNKSIKRSKYGQNLDFLAMVLPGFAWFFFLCYLPMYGIVLAFKDFRFTRGGFFDSLASSKWVGFDNFHFLFASHDAWIITRNTICYNLAFIVFGTICALLIAIILNELLSQRLAKLFQTLIFLPYFLPIIVVGYILFSFLSVDKGTLNQLLIFFNCQPVDWYSKPGYWPYILVLTNLW